MKTETQALGELLESSEGIDYFAEDFGGNPFPEAHSFATFMMVEEAAME